MVDPVINEVETAGAHYRTSGNGLLLLGAINSTVGLYGLTAGSINTFIAYDMMVIFGLTFMGTGVWMRAQENCDSTDV